MICFLQQWEWWFISALLCNYLEGHSPVHCLVITSSGLAALCRLRRTIIASDPAVPCYFTHPTLITITILILFTSSSDSPVIKHIHWKLYSIVRYYHCWPIHIRDNGIRTDANSPHKNAVFCCGHLLSCQFVVYSQNTSDYFICSGPIVYLYHHVINAQVESCLASDNVEGGINRWRFHTCIYAWVVGDQKPRKK